MSPAELLMKGLELVFGIGARLVANAAKGDDEALAEMEDDHAALEAAESVRLSRKAARRAANDDRIEALRRRQEAPVPLPGVDARPAPVDVAIDDDEILK